MKSIQSTDARIIVPGKTFWTNIGCPPPLKRISKPPISNLEKWERIDPGGYQYTRPLKRDYK